MAQDFFTAHVALLAEVSEVLAAIVLVIVLAGVLIWRFDRVPLEEAIYFAFITAFTVGFGDVTPKTRGARVVTVLLAFVGLVLVGILVAAATRSLESVLGVAT